MNIAELTDEDITKHRGMVYKLASKYIRQVRDPAIDFDDLLSEAYLALTKAYERFDPSKGFAFSTFAFTTVSGYLQSFIDRKGSQIRFPAHVVLLGNRINRLDLAEKPADEIAQQLDLSVEQVKAALDYLKKRLTPSLDRPMTNSATNTPDQETDMSSAVGQEDDLSRMFVQEFLDTLCPKNRAVAELLMQGYNRRQIGKMQDVSHQAIWQRLEKIKTEYLKFEQGVSRRRNVSMSTVAKEGPNCGLTRDILIEQVAKGETFSSIERAWGMKYNTIHNWVKKWGLKGLTPEKAQALLDRPMEPVPVDPEPELLREKNTTSRPATELELLNKAERELERLSGEMEKLTTERDQLLKCQAEWKEQEENLLRYIDDLEAERTDRMAPVTATLEADMQPARSIECIEAIEAATVGLEGAEAYSTGAVIESLWRWKRKNGLEDLKKARLYLDRLIGGSSGA